MTITKITFSLVLFILTATSVFADGNVTYTYGTLGYEFQGDDADNEIYIIPTTLGDEQTPGVWVFGYQTAINGQTDEFGNGNLMLTTGRDIRVKLGDGDDEVRVNGLDLANRKISVIGEGGMDEFYSYGSNLGDIFLERMDEIDCYGLTCTSMTVNEYSGTQVPHRLGLTFEDVEVWGDFTLNGINGESDVVTLMSTVVWGFTDIDLNSGNDLLYLDTVWFIDGLLAEFDGGNDMLYCDGNVYSGRNSAVRGGTTRRNRRASQDVYTDQLIINGNHSVDLGSASQWEDSDY